MNKTVTLSYNGISNDYRTGNTKRSCENRIEFLKGVFAKNYVVRKWVNSGKLERKNFDSGVSGISYETFNEDTLSETELKQFNSEVEMVKPAIIVIYNKTV